MNYSIIFYTLGTYFFFFAACFIPSLLIALLGGERKMGLIYGGIILFISLLGLILFLLTRSRKGRKNFTKKEGILTVALIWISSCIIGGMPFYLSGEIPLLISAIFESVSGFTTTGSSVLTDIEALPQSLLFWRSFTHWLGGLGIVLLFVAILPYLGMGGRVLFQSEATGLETSALKPKVRETALMLLKIYLIFTAIETLLLLVFGMTFFDALCHTFGTLATGGFSTKNASIGHYNSLGIEIVIIVFMVLSGASFSLYYYFSRGERKVFFESVEFKTYIGSLFFITLIIALHLTLYYREDFWLNLRESAFSVVSIHTATGFGTADFDQWTSFSKLLLVFIMIVGGCAGSTAGGIKVIRLVILIKYIKSRILNTFHPQAVVPVKVQGKAIDDETVKEVIGLFCLWILVIGGAALILTFMGLDMVTSLTAAVTAQGGVGPGLSAVGPANNFACIPEGGKVVLIICMLFGRLEIYTLLILFLPSFWKK